MLGFPIVVCFYTKETLYQLEVQNLIASCEKWGLETCIEGVASLGSWELNCAYKPFFLYDKLKAFKRPLLWVDADGVFIKSPGMLDVFEADFAVRINAECEIDHPSKVISSTVYINCTPGGEEILRLWMDETRGQLLQEDRKEEFWDQTALRDAIFKREHGADVKPMPLSYAKIFDHQGDGKEVIDPVIEHYQASRRLKKIVNQTSIAFKSLNY